MDINLQQPELTSAVLAPQHTSLWKRFLHWSGEQEKYRFGWLAASITAHGCVMTILTMMAIVFSGNHFIFWPFAIGAMGLSLITNLAAMPTRITVPVFFLSLLIDLGIIASCAVIGFDASSINM